MPFFRVSVITSFATSDTPPRTTVYDVEAQSAREAQLTALDYESQARRHLDEVSESIRVEVHPLGP